MTRNNLDVDTNQFDDSLENIENKENSSTNRTFEIKDDKVKSVFYEIPNTPVSMKRKRRINSKIRDEIRKSLNSTVTLRKTIEIEQLKRQQQKVSEKTVESNVKVNDGTFIKQDKKVKSKEKICDVVYLKTIDNLLNAINVRLEFGKINSNFKDDFKYIEVFQENVNKLASHLHSKLKFNAGLKILKWYKNRLEIRKAKQILNELKVKRDEAKQKEMKANEDQLKLKTDAAIVIQKYLRRYQAKKIYKKLLIEKSNQLRNNAALKIQRNYRLHSVRKQHLNRLKEEQKIRNQSARIIQKNWRNLVFKKRLTELIESKRLVQNRSALLIQKNWKNYLFKKRLINLIEKRRVEKLRNLQHKSALLIQKNWRTYQLKKNLIRTFEHNQQVKQNSALLIQRNWRIYSFKNNLNKLIEQKKIHKEIELQKNRSALIIQRTWRRYQLIKNLNKLIEQRKLMNSACLKIRRAWFRYKLIKKLNDQIKLKRLELENRSAIVIQSGWRMYQAKKKLDQLKYENHLNNAAQIIQRNWHSYIFRKNLLDQMKLNQHIKLTLAAMTIQRAFRSYLDRKKLSGQKKVDAAIKIQKVWRGYTTRLQYMRDNKNASIILERISEVNKNATTEPTIGQKTKVAIQKLLNYKYFDTALQILEELEKTTNLSNESCIQMANITIIEVLLRVASECNRSEPSLIMIKLVFSVILNIAKNDKALPILSSIPSLKETIIETLNKHYKKTGIFLKAMTLLYILLKYENFPDSPAFTVKIKRLLSKISENQNHTSSRKRNQLKPVYQFDPRWCSKKQIRAQFYTTRQALDAFYQIYN